MHRIAPSHRIGFRLAPEDQRDLDALADRLGDGGASRALGVTEGTVVALAHGGTATEVRVDRMSAALEEWRQRTARRSA